MQQQHQMHANMTPVAGSGAAAAAAAAVRRQRQRRQSPQALLRSAGVLVLAVAAAAGFATPAAADKPLPAAAGGAATTATTAAAAAAPEGAAVLGFHEGGRRVVRCAGGGHVVGLEGYLWQAGGFPEPTVNALRVKCSTKKLDVDLGPSPLDDAVTFGNAPPSVIPVAADCPAGAAVAAVEWRRGDLADRDGPARAGGLRVRCTRPPSLAGSSSSSELLPPILIDSRADREYPLPLRCSELQPAGSSGGSSVEQQQQKQQRLTGLEVWFEQLFAGMSFAACEPAAGVVAAA